MPGIFLSRCWRVILIITLTMHLYVRGVFVMWAAIDCF